MNRLERMIERLTAQRICLDHAATLVRDLSGPVFELGLGKGRTYSHLRTLFPAREIYAFDLDLHAPPDSVPEGDRLVLGDLRETLPRVAGRAGGRAALIHADLGSEDPAADAALMRELAPLIAAAVRPGGVVVGDRALDHPDLAPLPLPSGLPDWPYFMYRARGVAAGADGQRERSANTGA